MAFTGFTETSISFLKDLAVHNDKTWFGQNRARYEEHLLMPMKQLVNELGPVMKSIDEKIDTTPQINKTISKIYRDTRFSMDKSPFRIDPWIMFKRPVRIWGNVPEFYFYFTPEEYQFGMGYYAAAPATMDAIRRNIDRDPVRFSTILKQFNQHNICALYGEEYKKKISNPHPEIFQKWYQKKNFYVSCMRKIDESFFSPHLKDEIESAYLSNTELYRFIVDSVTSGFLSGI